jgi:hypothetical protein
MPKVTLNTIGSRYGSVDALNDNFDSIEVAIENTLSRDGTGPNAMEAPLDMNAQPILNASTVYAGSLVIGGKTVVAGGDVTVVNTAQIIEFLATEGQTSRSLAPLTPSTSALEFLVNGLEIPTSKLSTVGSTLTFPALKAGDEVLIRIFTANIGAAPDFALSQLIPVTRAEDLSGGATDEGSYLFRRRATYSGGTPGFVNSCIRADTFVESSIGSGTSSAAAYEWTATFVMHNYSTSGQNVGMYAQGIKYPGAGSTWGATVELIDWQTNPALGAVCQELSYTANGTDTNANRVGMDLSLRKRNPVGAAPVLSWGYRIQTEAGSLVDRGFGYTSGATVNKGFDTSLATVTQAAFVMAQSQPIAFNAALSRKLFHNGTSWLFTNVSNGEIWALNDDYSLRANGVQLLGTRRTGWVAPTGTATRSTFVTSTVTVSQLAERVKALIDDLTTHGLIGV